MPSLNFTEIKQSKEQFIKIVIVNVKKPQTQRKKWFYSIEPEKGGNVSCS
jgi:hypothetical protein